MNAILEKLQTRPVGQMGPLPEELMKLFQSNPDLLQKLSQRGTGYPDIGPLINPPKPVTEEERLGVIHLPSPPGPRLGDLVSPDMSEEIRKSMGEVLPDMSEDPIVGNKGIIADPVPESIEDKFGLPKGGYFSEAAKEALGKEGEGIEVGQTPISKIDTEFSGDYSTESSVRGIMEKIRKGEQVPPILISENGYLQDGRHRLEAYKRLGYKEVPTIVGFDPSVSALKDKKSGKEIPLELKEYLGQKYKSKLSPKEGK